MARSLLPFTFGGPPSTDPFTTLHREMNRLFDDVFRGVGSGSAAGGGFAMAPHLDISESDQAIRICAELPGVSEKDVQVELADDMLTIRGEKRAEQENKDESYHVRERSYGSFSRSIQLPYSVDPAQVKASFDNGVLTVTLPKAAAQHKVHRVAVQSGASQPGGARISAVDRAAAGDKPSGETAAPAGMAGDERPA